MARGQLSATTARLAVVGLLVLTGLAPAAALDSTRIVAVGGAVTEILYALGLEDRIVAVDSTSLYPPRALKQKQNVGYMRALAAEGILGLAPTLVLATAGAGPKDTVAVLKSSGVPLVMVPDQPTAEGIAERIRLIAALTRTMARGECLAQAVEHDFAGLARFRARIDKPVRVIFVMSAVNHRLMVAGRNTAADAMIAMAGAVNAASGFDGYKPIGDEALIVLDPDAVITMERDGSALDAQRLRAHPALMHSPAARRDRIVAMDGHYLLGFGPRAARAAVDLAASLYPELASASAQPAFAETHGDGCAQ